MRALLLGTCLVAVTGSSCGTSTCAEPTGCHRADAVSGSCQCLEWETVRVETVPIKFVVVSVVYRGIGNESWLAYGWTPGSGSMPAANSELGTRFRAVFRDEAGIERTALMANADVGSGLGGALSLVTPESADFLLAWGDGQGSGSALGFGSSFDAPGLASDEIAVWVNPTLTVTTNYLGEKLATWSWTSVGHCFWPTQLSCEGPHVAGIPVDVLDGTRITGDPYTALFLATLTPAERAGILAYHPLHDPADRDPATLGTDSRFLSLGPAEVHEGGASWPTAAWTPCTGALSDASFEVLHQAPSLSSYNVQGSLLLEHSVLSAEAICRPRQPGLSLATSTPGCAVTASVYLDRMFGTLLFVPTDVAPSCTRPP
jgi:hypothetical protein